MYWDQNQEAEAEKDGSEGFSEAFGSEDDLPINNLVGSVDEPKTAKPVPQRGKGSIQVVDTVDNTQNFEIFWLV